MAGQFCAYCGRSTQSPEYEPGDWVGPMVFPHSTKRWPAKYLKEQPYLLPLCVHIALTRRRCA